jgi:hypothetical protein
MFDGTSAVPAGAGAGAPERMRGVGGRARAQERHQAEIRTTGEKRPKGERRKAAEQGGLPSMVADAEAHRALAALIPGKAPADSILGPPKSTARAQMPPPSTWLIRSIRLCVNVLSRREDAGFG